MEIDPKEIRRSVIAGSWYPGSADELRRNIDSFLGNVPEGKVAGEPMGLIAPHAGYIYSGQVAAYAYKQLEDMNFKKVVIISPIHQFYPGRYIVTTKHYYQTPLGLVEVDAQTVEAIGQEMSLSPVNQDSEHSLEIQLPFLQRVLGEFKLVPIMLGDQSLSACRALGRALAGAIRGKSALLVASTDLSHYHNYDTAVQLDKVVLKHIEAFDPEGLARDLAAGRCEACGAGAIMATMFTAKALGADKAGVLKYANSGDVTGDRGRVVGYMAGVLYQRYPMD